MPRPDISILIPARNEGARIGSTILSIARARTTGARLEFIVVDDGSTDDSLDRLTAALPLLLDEKNIDVRVCRMEQNLGNYFARNEAAELSSAPILFTTDAHVEFSLGWDELVFEHLDPDRILAGTTTQKGTSFKGFGCQLLIPLMDTWWNNDLGTDTAPVQIAACSATVLSRDLFFRLGGYDTGMILYGGGEAEFSVRAWLHGAEVHAIRGLEVQHEFKSEEQLLPFMEQVRLVRVHNSIRFGLLYLSEPGCLQLLRYFALKESALFAKVLGMINRSDVWQRRAELEGQRLRPFEWFVQHFDLHDQVGGMVL